MVVLVFFWLLFFWVASFLVGVRVFFFSGWCHGSLLVNKMVSFLVGVLVSLGCSGI